MGTTVTDVQFLDQFDEEVLHFLEILQRDANRAIENEEDIVSLPNAAFAGICILKKQQQK